MSRITALTPYTFTIGGADFTAYLTELNLSCTAAEIGSFLVWTGSFTLSYAYPYLRVSDYAEQPLNSFDEETNSDLRRAMAAVVLSIQGTSILTFRIDNYRFDSIAQVGTGSLTQIITYYAQPRSAFFLPGVEIGGGTQLSKVINDLVVAAGASIEGSINAPETQDVDLVTDNPIADAQRLAGLYFHWLITTVNETIEIVSYPATASGTGGLAVGNFVSIRPASSDDPSHEQICITGARQVATENPTVAIQATTLPNVPNAANDPDAAIAFDAQGRPVLIVTETSRSASETYDRCEEAAAITDEALEERKTIRYFYANTTRPSQVPGVSGAAWDSLPPDALVKVETTRLMVEAKALPNCLDKACPQLILGTIPPNFAPTYIIGERLIETAGQKLLIKPRGAVTRSEDDFCDPTLVVARRETIKNVAVLPDGTFQPAAPQINQPPATGTGNARVRLNTPVPDPPTAAPEFTVEPELIEGKATFEAIGYSQLLPKTFKRDVGFLPSQDIANQLARNLGLLFLQQRDSDEVTLSIDDMLPWALGGCKPFTPIDVYLGRYIIDSPKIVLQNGGLYVRFTGNKLGRRSTPVPSGQASTITGNAFTVYPINPIIIETGEVIDPVQVVAIGGVAPYSYAGTLAPGLAVDPATGLINGTAGAVTAGQNYTITVTDNALDDVTVTVWIDIVAVESPSIGVSDVIDASPRFIYKPDFFLLDPAFDLKDASNLIAANNSLSISDASGLTPVVATVKGAFASSVTVSTEQDSDPANDDNYNLLIQPKIGDTDVIDYGFDSKTIDVGGDVEPAISDQNLPTGADRVVDIPNDLTGFNDTYFATFDSILTPNGNDCCVDIAFRIDTIPTGGNRSTIYDEIGSSETGGLALDFTNAALILAYANSGSGRNETSHTITLVTGTWYKVRIKFIESTNALTLALNNTVVISTTFDVDAGDPPYFGNNASNDQGFDGQMLIRLVNEDMTGNNWILPWSEPSAPPPT